MTPDSPEYQAVVEDTIEKLRAEIIFKVKKGYTQEEVYLYLRSIIDYFRTQPEYKEKVTCGSINNCSFCCHSEIPMGNIEAQYIKKVIKNKGIKPNLIRLMEQINNPHGLKWMAKACPLLGNVNDQGKRLCTIYEDRPLICRTHNSNEHPLRCDRSDEPNRIVKETRSTIFEAVAMTAILINPNPRKMITMLHDVLGEMVDWEEIK